MTPIRQKMFEKLGKQFGSKPPSWTSDGLGQADRDPGTICSGVDLNSFQGAGDDWLVDPKGDRTGLSLAVGADLVAFKSGAVTMRMIKSTLWAAEQMGKIAMPARLKVSISGDGRLVTIRVE